MGSKLSKTEEEGKCGFLIFDVHPSGPAAKVGLVANVDMILYVNGVAMNKNKRRVLLFKIIQEYFMEQKPVVLTVVNYNTHAVRDVTILPTDAWPGDGLIGIKIRFDTLTDMNQIYSNSNDQNEAKISIPEIDSTDQSSKSSHDSPSKQDQLTRTLSLKIEKSEFSSHPSPLLQRHQSAKFNSKSSGSESPMRSPQRGINSSLSSSGSQKSSISSNNKTMDTNTTEVNVDRFNDKE